MSKHFENEIDRLKKKILHLTAMVEENLMRGVKSLEDNDTVLADEVIKYDEQVDSYEVEVEEECLKILALHQPVAADLRYVVAVLKINSDLERIGDLAVNIAKRSKAVNINTDKKMPFDLHGMLELTVKLVKDSTDALVANDTAKARQVCIDDDKIDNIHKQAFTTIKERIASDIDNIDYYINLLSVSRNLERIADHATNIAEDIIYNAEGEIVRHRPREK